MLTLSRFGIIAGALTGLFLIDSRAFAQDLEDKVQLGLDLGLLSFNKSSIDLDDTDDEVDTDKFAVGTLPSAAVRAGYAVTPNVVIGGFFELSYSQVDLGDAESDTVEVGIGPTVEYIFGTGAFRPFLAAALALAYQQSDAGPEVDQLLFGGGISGGMHLFLTESVSVDPSFGFAFGAGSGSVDNNAGNNVDYGVTAWGIDAKIGLSAWF